VAALEASKQLLTLTKEQYRLGAVNYIALINAEHQYTLALINAIQAQAARYTDTAALFQALGGGWWHQPLFGENHRG
jgi:outer membrane protein TolC